MDKRLTKRHERQVARAKERVWLSEPDLRTPEQIRAARKASRQAYAQSRARNVHNSVPSFQTRAAPGTGSAAKTDV